MKEFKVLPTNPDFQALTSHQVEFIMANMETDAEIQKLIAQGKDPSNFIKDSDSSWWEDSVEEFDPKGGLDISDEEISRQVEELTSIEDRKRLEKISEDNQEWSDYLETEGNDRDQMTTENTIQEKLRKAQEDAQRLASAGQSQWGKVSISDEEKEHAQDMEPMTQESIEEAYRLFEGEEEVTSNGPDDEWI